MDSLSYRTIIIQGHFELFSKDWLREIFFYSVEIIYYHKIKNKYEFH